MSCIKSFSSQRFKATCPVQRGCHDYCSREGPLDHPSQENLMLSRCYQPAQWKLYTHTQLFLLSSHHGSFPCKLNASAHTCGENFACSFISFSAVTMSPLLLAKRGGRIKITILQHVLMSHYLWICLRTDLLPEAEKKW